jgi:short-subunit dehydrogenase
MRKYAVLSLSEALEHELEGTNVGVSVLCPGPVNTNIPRGARNRPEHMVGLKSELMRKRSKVSAPRREVLTRRKSANAW